MQKYIEQLRFNPLHCNFVIVKGKNACINLRYNISFLLNVLRIRLKLID